MNQNKIFLARIDKFVNLETGWHFGEGFPVSHEAAASGIALYYFMGSLGFHEAEPFPLLDGGLLICFYLYSDKTIEFEILPKGKPVEISWGEDQLVAVSLPEMYRFILDFKWAENPGIINSQVSVDKCSKEVSLSEGEKWRNENL